MARKTLIKMRQDTAANWASVNPTLALGEFGLETDTGKVKRGDGAVGWNTLVYFNYLATMKDVTITDLTTNDTMKWNGTAWVNSAPAGGHTQGTDTGTTSTTFQIDSGGSGPKLKNASGVLEIRNAADGAYASIKVLNLEVTGTTTTINTETVTIDDNIIVLNNNEAGSPSENAGIEVERGSAVNASILWDESSDAWFCGLVGSLVQILTLPSGIARGDIMMMGASAMGKLVPGSAYKVLMSNGASNDLTYEDIDGGSA